MVGESSAERIKKEIGSACPPEKGEGRSVEIKGRDLINGVPKEIVITERQVAESLEEPVSAIVEAVRIALDRCPPDIAADLIDSGIMLAGGGAQLKGLDRLITEETGLMVLVAEDPLNAVVKGTGVMLQNDLIYRN